MQICFFIILQKTAEKLVSSKVSCSPRFHLPGFLLVPSSTVLCKSLHLPLISFYFAVKYEIRAEIYSNIHVYLVKNRVWIFAVSTFNLELSVSSVRILGNSSPGFLKDAGVFAVRMKLQWCWRSDSSPVCFCPGVLPCAGGMFGSFHCLQEFQ